MLADIVGRLNIDVDAIPRQILSMEFREIMRNCAKCRHRELYLKEGKLELAKKQLAKLDKLCFFGCKEFDDLKAAIKAYVAGGGFKGFSKQPQSAN